MRKQNNFETMWQEEDNLWIKPYSIMTGFNSYITTIIHSPKKYFCKRSLFPQTFAHFSDMRFSCIHFWTNILLLLLQTANTMVETKCHKWRRADLTWHVTMMSRSVSRGLCVTKMWRGDRGGLWWDRDGAQRIHDMLIKRGASNEFLHVALIKSTRDN